MVAWNPDTYLQFADERSRPFADLLARVGATDPAVVVDLGCGPGQLTASLARRWPGASVLGIDSSAAMVERAREHAGERVRFVEGDLRTWSPEEPVDVLVSNATLQWVPDHRALLPRLLEAVRPGGWLAFQVPGNLDEPSHTLRSELAAEEPYAAHTAGVAAPLSHDPTTYLDLLAGLGCTVDAWETTYLHLLTDPEDPDPVFTWVSGTGARPTLQALPDDLRPGFEEEFKRRLRAAYPARPYGVVLPFRRIFAVARVGS
jgi:trans-aconitate 2-methyltransferase